MEETPARPEKKQKLRKPSLLDVPLSAQLATFDTPAEEQEVQMALTAYVSSPNRTPEELALLGAWCYAKSDKAHEARLVDLTNRAFRKGCCLKVTWKKLDHSRYNQTGSGHLIQVRGRENKVGSILSRGKLVPIPVAAIKLVDPDRRVQLPGMEKISRSIVQITSALSLHTGTEVWFDMELKQKHRKTKNVELQRMTGFLMDGYLSATIDPTAPHCSIQVRPAAETLAKFVGLWRIPKSRVLRAVTLDDVYDKLVKTLADMAPPLLRLVVTYLGQLSDSKQQLLGVAKTVKPKPAAAVKPKTAAPLARLFVDIDEDGDFAMF